MRCHVYVMRSRRRLGTFAVPNDGIEEIEEEEEGVRGNECGKSAVRLRQEK